MDLVPSGLFPLLALALIAVGLALVFRRGVPKAYGLGMVMMAVFLLDVLAGMLGDGRIQGALGFRATDPQWWTPVTSAFVHSGFRGGSLFNLHLFGNLFILLTAGPALEARVGDRRFLVIFFVAHAAALLTHVALGFASEASPRPFLSRESLALGASGGIFGVLTAFAVRYPREKLPMLLLFFVFWMQASLVLLLYLGFNFVYFLTDFLAGSPSGIGWWGHFAGFFVGLAFAARLPAVASTTEPIGSSRGLPDPEKLEPLATTPELKRILERVRQFTPESRTAHDTTFALTWVDKFLSKATCPDGHGFERTGLTARCTGGETKLDLARASGSN